MEEPIIHEPKIQEIYYQDDDLNKLINSPDFDLTNIDKLLSKADSEHTKELIKKERLTREDFADLHHTMASSELKLININSYERSLLGSIFAWACDFVSVAEKLYETEDDIIKRYGIKIDEGNEEKIIKFGFQDENGKIIINDDAQEIYEILDNILKSYTSSMKRVVLTYFFVSRSSLSMGGSGFDIVSKQRFEHIGGETINSAKPTNRFGLFKKE